jgi:hypothetical protein
MVMNFEKEIRELQQQLAAAVKRIGEMEGSFGYIAGQLREVQNFLHQNVDARLTGLEGKVENGFARVEKRFDKIEADVAGLRKELPGIVTEAVRDVIRSR